MQAVTNTQKTDIHDNMKRLFLFLFVCTLFTVKLFPQQSMTLMFCNAENLFDPEDDPLKDDDAYTPDGDYRWTRSRYRDKLDAISKVIVAADEEQAPAMYNRFQDWCCQLYTAGQSP